MKKILRARCSNAPMISDVSLSFLRIASRPFPHFLCAVNGSVRGNQSKFIIVGESVQALFTALVHLARLARDLPGPQDFPLIRGSLAKNAQDFGCGLPLPTSSREKRACWGPRLPSRRQSASRFHITAAGVVLPCRAKAAVRERVLWQPRSGR